MKCWVQIVDSHGVSYKESRATRVTVDDDAIIDDLCNAIKVKCPTILSSIEASQLTVYETKSDLLDNKQSLEVDFIISGLGRTKETTLFVVVPDDPQQQGTSV
jgi:hypothetical protein